MATDSEEVEKVLQSLASEAGASEFSSSADEDGEPDRDKVEELLRQLEQEKEDSDTVQEEPKITKNIEVIAKNEEEKGESNNNDEGEDYLNTKPKPSGLKKPNGNQSEDKPAAPTRRKEPPGDDIPKPWKKKGAIRKQIIVDDDDFFTIAAKEPPPTIKSDVDAQEPTAMETEPTSQPIPSNSTDSSSPRISVAPKTPNSNTQPLLATNGAHNSRSPPASPLSSTHQPNSPKQPTFNSSSPVPTSPSVAPSSPSLTPPAISLTPSSPSPSHATTPSSPVIAPANNPVPNSPTPTALNSAHPSSPSSISSSIPSSSSPLPTSPKDAPSTPPSVHITTHAPPTTPTSSQPVPLPVQATPPPSVSSNSSFSSSSSSTTTTSSPVVSKTSPPPTRNENESTHKKEATPPKQNKALAEDILLDDSVQDETAVFSKQDFANLRSQILKQAAEETAILAQEFQELKLKHDDELRGKLRLKSVLVEYEKTIAKLIDDAGMSGHHEALADRVIELENEVKRKTEEYEAISSAHTELKSRHENTKEDNEKLKSNEQVQKEMVSRLQNELHASETRFNMLKSHAETKLDTASEQLVKLRDERAKEMALLQTRTQKAEARTMALEKENKELLLICDDLMEKIEQKNI